MGLCLLYNYDGEIPNEFQYFTDTSVGGNDGSDFCPFRDGYSGNRYIIHFLLVSIKYLIDYEGFYRNCRDTQGNDDTIKVFSVI